MVESNPRKHFPNSIFLEVITEGELSYRLVEVKRGDTLTKLAFLNNMG